MSSFSISNVRMSGIAAAIPENSMSNEQLIGLGKEEKELLIQTVGINKKRIAQDGLKASDLCFTAAQKLLNEMKLDTSEIDVLLFVTQTPDYLIPANSMILQDRLGLGSHCLTLDINQGCAGYVYGLSTMANLLSASGKKKGLLLVGDTISKILEPSDLSTVPIFSDAGSATLLEYDENAPKMYFNLQTDGSNHRAILAEGQNSSRPNGDPYLRMKGHDIFTFGLREVIPNLETLLKYAALEKEDVDYFLFHQANLLLNEAIRRKGKLPREKVPMTLSKFGNTSCATIPLTFVSELHAVQEKELTLALSGFGVGLSWGASLLKVSNICCPELIEVK